MCVCVCVYKLLQWLSTKESENLPANQKTWA